MFHLSNFNCVFRSNKQFIEIDVFATLTALLVPIKRYEIEKNTFHFPILVFKTYLTVVAQWYQRWYQIGTIWYHL